MKKKTPSLKIMQVKKAETFQATLSRSLRRLKNDFGACGLKLSTEDAAMTIEQIKFWADTSLLPVVVKIGGPNARNDIKQLVPLKIDGLIAPMVESPYGLENFIAAVRDFTTPMQFGRLHKHINIETITAIKQLDDILNAAEAKFLDEITIGCSDLSGSLKKSGIDASVLRRVTHAVKKIQAKNIAVSVGGGIQPESIDRFLKKVQPDKFNTRVVTFDVVSGQKYDSAVAEKFRIKALKTRLQ